MGSTT